MWMRGALILSVVYQHSPWIQGKWFSPNCLRGGRVPKLVGLPTPWVKENFVLGKVRFNLGMGGALERRVISKYFTNWGGSSLFHTQPGEGSSIFDKEKIIPCRLVDSYLLTNTRSV